MPSPSTMILRSGGAAAGSCLAGGGAREKSSRTTRFGSCCWNGANSSPPNQPPNPERCCGCGREGPPKLKNWAEAGPATPSSSVAATVTAISGPASQNTRKNDFGWAMRFGSKQGNAVPDILAESGRKRADQVADSSAINRPSAAAVKGGAELSGSRLPQVRNRVTASAEPGYRNAARRDGTGGRTPERRPNQCPRSLSSTSEEANPSAGAPIEAWKPRNALRVSPPNWPSGVPR